MPGRHRAGQTARQRVVEVIVATVLAATVTGLRW
jgi:hypothetical protein